MDPSLLDGLKQGLTPRDLKSLIKPETVNFSDENGVSPLSLCFKHKSGGKTHRIDIAKLILSAGANPNVRMGPDGTLMHAACKNVNVDWIKLLLSNKVDLDARDPQGRTCLHVLFSSSVLDKVPEIAQLLISHGAQLSAADNSGKTVAQTALESKIPLDSLVTFLPLSREEIDAFIDESLMKALNTNNLKDIVSGRGLSGASVRHVLKLFRSTESDFPRDIFRLRNCQVMIRAWLLRQNQLDDSAAAELLELCCRASVKLPGTAPLFMKNHARVLEINPTIKADKMLHEAMFDLVFNAYQSGTKELMLLLSYLSGCLDSKPRLALLWDNSNTLCMQTSSLGRRGGFSAPSIPLGKTESASRSSGFTSAISFVTSMFFQPSSSPTISFPLDSISTDILIEILLRCRFDTDILNVSRTCKSLHERVGSFSPSVWMQLMEKFRVPPPNKEGNSSLTLKKAFQTELGHRQRFRSLNDFSTARVTQLDDEFAGPDALCAIPGRDGVFAIVSTAGDIALLDAGSDKGGFARHWKLEEGSIYEPTFSSDGNKMFAISSVYEDQFLCVSNTDFSQEATLERHRIEVAVLSTDPCPPYGRIQLTDETKILQNPGVFYDIGNGNVKHVSTLNWPASLEAKVEGANEIDVSTLLQMDRADWSNFAFHVSNPHQILARYLYWSWLYDTRVSNDPVMTFPVHRSHLDRSTLDNPLEMKTEHSAWLIDKYGNLLEYDLRNASIFKKLNLVCEANQSVDPSQTESFSISACMDTARSRIFLSYLYRAYECSISWDLSGSVPEMGTFVSQPQRDNSLGGSALSESWLAVWRYNPTGPDILAYPL